MSRNTCLIFSLTDMWEYGKIVSTWGSEQGLAVRMIIFNQLSILKEFNDVITYKDSNYYFRRLTLGVQ